MSGTDSDRRIHPRYAAPYHVVVSVEEAQQLAALTDDISHGGLFLTTDHDLPVAQIVDLTLHLPDGKRAIRCAGKIVRRSATGESRVGYGVEFQFRDPKEAVNYVRRLDALIHGRAFVAPTFYDILVVEDNEVVRDLVANSLSLLWERRYQNGPFLSVDLAASGDAALELVQTKEYRLVVCDVFMPRLDGRAFIRAVRREKETEQLPILAISAADVGDNVMQLDADAFLRKPLQVKELFQTVHMLLAGRSTNADRPATPAQSESPIEQALRSLAD